jgi:hypothetical protein
MIRQTSTTSYERPTVEVSLLTDPVECEKARLQRAQFDRNSRWLQQHISDVYVPANRGKIVCIAGEEAFFGDTVEEVAALATAAHPDDKGSFMRYIPRQKMTWIYAT